MMTNYHSLITLILFGVTLSCHCEITKNICATITYIAPEYQSLSEAKQTAINKAKIQALADEFGTIVSQTNTTTIHSNNGKSENNFNTYSETEVRGIWIKDTQEPEISISYTNNNIMFKVTVCGKAKEIKSNPIELNITTLNSGYHNNEENPYIEGRETTEFSNGDFFSVRFQSPVNGYIAIFLRDDNNGIVFTQLPYINSDGYAIEVKSNKAYEFLNNNDPQYPYKTSTILTANKEIETNTLIVVFSRKKFHISLSNQGEWFPEIEYNRFKKWINGLCAFDNTTQVKEISLTIKK